MGMRVSIPRGTYYILGDFTGLWEGDDRAYVGHLIDRCGVAAIPASAFYTLHPEEGTRLVRFAFCKRRKTLSEAAQRLKSIER